MKKVVLLLLLLSSLNLVWAGNIRTITGTVYDAKDNQPIASVSIKAEGTPNGTSTNKSGQYKITVQANQTTLVFTFIGYETKKVKLRASNTLNILLQPTTSVLSEVVVTGYQGQNRIRMTESAAIINRAPVAPMNQALSNKTSGIVIRGGIKDKKSRFYTPQTTADEESYKGISENSFQNPKESPLSTFSVDVDAASYSNVRRFINNGQLPPKDAVRIEEMINYFSYNMASPAGDEPVAIHTELSAAPWNKQHRLLRIGLKAKTVQLNKLPGSNLVFLIDVSGSMNEPNKLPLVQSSLKMLTDQLRAKDKVAIVVYAGNAGLVLPPTPGDQKISIKDAIDRLSAGGSTAGGQGIRLAYRVAKENFLKGGNNRVILATDGDFNVGASSDDVMQNLIEQERKSGVFLSVLGFGMGNYKDSKMETLADKGNGNYAYIDNITEARKTLVSEFGSTLFTIAKDVKLQIEFNPAKVQAYRLIGYENRLLNKEDFNNDLKDAGDMGAGHTVTALYEIIPQGVKDQFSSSVDRLKYQKEKKITAGTSSEMLTIKFRYKEPASSVSKLSQVTLLDQPVNISNTSSDYRFAAAVAEIGMLLRDSDYKQGSGFKQAIDLARAAKGDDHEGYRAEFIKLAESAKLLANGNSLAVEK
ncbi:MAG: DUF3520 domain-containing protein [Sphingobacteriaceae bacterium]|nr:MAG: DUF3520 domain-containing protein [Sphingobacteriaceae bacterium]